MNRTRVFRRMPVIIFVFALAVNAVGQSASSADLIAEAARVRGEDPVKAFNLYTQAFELAAKVNDSDVARAASEAVTLGFIQGGDLLSKASALLLKALPVIDKAGDTSLDAAMVYYTAGYYYFSYEPLKWEEALKYFNKSLAIRTQRLGEQNSEVALCYSRIGDVYKYLLSDYAAAEDCYEKSIHINERIGSTDKLQLARSYYNLATTNRSQRDYERALNYGVHTIDLVRELNDPPFLERTLSIVGNICRDMGRTDDATKYYEQAIQLNRASRTRNTFTDEALAGHYQNYGTLLQLGRRYDDALKRYQQAAGIYKSIRTSEKTMEVNCYQHIGETYALMGDRSRALSMYRRTLSLLHALNLGGSRKSTEVKVAIGDIHQSMHRADSALYYYQAALIADVDSFSATDVATNPTREDIGQHYYLYGLFLSKAKALYEVNRQRAGTAGYAPVLESLRLAEELLRKSRNALDVEESKWTFLDSNYDLYEQSIAILTGMKGQLPVDTFNRAAYAFFEYGKSRTLANAVMEAELAGQMFASDSLIRRQNALKAAQFNLQDRLNREEGKVQPDGQNLLQLRADMIETDRQIQQVRQLVTEKFPGYSRARFEEHVPDLDVVLRKARDEQAALVEYFWGLDHVYAFAIRDNDVVFRRIGATDSVIQQLTPLLNYLTGRDSHLDTTVHRTFTHAAAAAYDLLIRPFDLTNKSIVIVPDGLLAQLPFEVLLKDHAPAGTVDYKALPYVVYDHDISYSYSSSLWATATRQIDRSPSVLAMSFSGGGNAASLTNLPGALNELEFIGRHFGENEMLIGNAASKDNFKQKASAFDIIHLAIHGTGDPGKRYAAMLYFSPSERDDGVLHAYELYGLTLHARLAILSACESGLGMNYRGEGMMSMASAFAYAGCENVMMSLWNVSDQQSALLLDNFYASLPGSRINTALANAKRSYLQDADALTADPRLWATMVAYGDMSPVFPTQQRLPVWLWGIGVLVVAIVATYLWRRRSAKGNVVEVAGRR